MRKAFTMVELIFVIVIIGILAGVAMSKMSVTRDDAAITKAKSQVASIRSALTNEAQRRMMEGNYTQIQTLGGTGGNAPIFDFFENGERILEYPPYACSGASRGCWFKTSNIRYVYKAPGGIGGSIAFVLNNNRFDCVTPGTKLCEMLDR